MSQLPPSIPPQPVQYATPLAGGAPADLANLNALAICHYVWGGLVALFACFGLLYVFIGYMFASGAIPTSQPGFGPASPGPSPVLMGRIFMGAGASVALIGWLCGALNIYAGRSLHTHRRRAYCFVVSAINCLAFPIGTVLGIFTFIILSRASVQQLFAEHRNG